MRGNSIRGTHGPALYGNTGYLINSQPTKEVIMLSVLITIILVGVCLVAVPLCIMAVIVALFGAAVRAVTEGSASLFK